jgi:hypothetical protein
LPLSPILGYNVISTFYQENLMSKERNTKKETKKAPAKSLKEKRDAKKEKKDGKK